MAPIFSNTEASNASAEGHLADVLITLGDSKAALQHSLSSFAIAESLARSDPNNAEYRTGLAIAHRRVANTLIANGDAAHALEHASAGVAILEEMARTSQDANLRESLERGRRVKAEIEGRHSH